MLVKHSAWHTVSSQYLEVIIIIAIIIWGGTLRHIFEIRILLKVLFIKLCQLNYARGIFF